MNDSPRGGSAISSRWTSIKPQLAFPRTSSTVSLPKLDALRFRQWRTSQKDQRNAAQRSFGVFSIYRWVPSPSYPSWLRLARDLEYLPGDVWNHLERLRNHAGILTWRLYDALMKGRR